MTHFAALAFFIACCMGALVWSCLPITSWRVASTAIFAAMTVSAYVAVVESTGQPKPLMMEWRNIADAEMVGLSWNEEQHKVYVWVMVGDQPIAYSLPWPADKKRMGELQDKWRRRGSTGDEFQLQMDGEVAKVVPPKPMPSKTQ